MFKVIIIFLLSATVINSHTPLEKLLRQYFSPAATVVSRPGGSGLSGGSSSGSPFANVGPSEFKHKYCYQRCREHGNYDCDCHEMCIGCDMTCDAPAGRQAPAPANVVPTTTTTTAKPSVTPHQRCLVRCQFWGAINCDQLCAGCGLIC